MIIKKDSEIVKEKVERKSIALMAKKESSDEECSTSDREDEEYAMAVRDFKKFFKRRGRFMGDSNHLIEECPKPPKDKNQRAFVGGSWSDSGEEDDEKVKDETCLVAHTSSEVYSESFYFSDENSSIDDLALDNEYDKLCKMSLKIITKNKRLKSTRNSLENELRELKDKFSILEKNKGVDLDCAKCHALKIENEKLKEEYTRLIFFEKSTHCLNEMLSNQKPFGDKLGLGFNSFEASSNGTKKIKFVKAQKKAPSDEGPINMGGPQSVHAAPKKIMGPPPATPESEKTLPFQKPILGPRPKHIIVNKVKVSVASDNKVKKIYKPLSKPGICLGVDLEPVEWIIDNGCSKHMTGNQKVFSTYKAYNGGNVIFCSNLRGNIIGKGKQAHASHKAKNVVSTTRCLELLHMDLFSPSVVRSYEGNRYTLVIVDDYSRTMLNEQSLPQKFWSEDTSTYILNRILIRAILGKTPYELLRGRKPTLDYFRVFGSKCFILNTKDYLTKFDHTSYKGVFLGYSQNSKAYIVHYKHTKKVEESLNVTFDETPPPSKTSPLVDDDLDEEEAIKGAYGCILGTLFRSVQVLSGKLGYEC
uniref:Transposase, Ptta/En/Spm, transposase, Tnp1/En/Spm-like protein n=1 Tax=Tanacetum cinerariifolium TaxID=118510 RepID=A0A6L2N1C1_TANCI|nr:transposase, Ptta/En/Spm, transposase, Tnp1/En/Spm-like protein [Tanacetum cinerariifolium]